VTVQQAARVSVRTHSIRRIRLARELPRYALAALAATGIAASARMALAPPRPVPSASPIAPPPSVDRGAESYAALFARRYLTWRAADPLGSVRALEGFAGDVLEPAAGLALPAVGSQRVVWVEVAQEREPQPGEHVYTVAAETEPQGLLYLTVTVTRGAGGAVELAGYPAFVGAPPTVVARRPARPRAIADGSLEVVVRRALGNYLSGAVSDLAADLTPGTVLAPSSLQLRLLSLQHPTWVPGGGAVAATVQAEDARGARYTLSYELDVRRAQGRWEISAVQTDPEAAA
jgi:hypothetical protein